MVLYLYTNCERKIVMNLSFKPNEIKQEVKETKLSRHIEAINQTKTASFFSIRLTHIETNISVDATGYNKIDVMSKCLNNLNYTICL